MGVVFFVLRGGEKFHCEGEGGWKVEWGRVFWGGGCGWYVGLVFGFGASLVAILELLRFIRL